MKTFEEKMTAWVDGELSGKALADFERELAHGIANHEVERDDMRKLGELLRMHGAAENATRFANGDFFNHQVLERIARESKESRSAANHQVRAQRAASGRSWPLAKLSLAGAFMLGAAAALFHFLIPVGPVTLPTASEYMAQVIDAQPGAVGISATPLHSKSNDLTVIWLEGADYVPADPSDATTANGQP